MSSPSLGLDRANIGVPHVYQITMLRILGKGQYMCSYFAVVTPDGLYRLYWTNGLN